MKCSRCPNPVDRNGRLCKSCHNKSMRDWRKGRISVPIAGRFHVKPFVNGSSRDHYTVKEEDGTFIVLLNGNPLDLGDIEERSEAERIAEGLAHKTVPLSALAFRDHPVDGEFAEG